MPGYRLIFGTVGLMLGFYGLISVQGGNPAAKSDRFDQPENVRRLIARAFENTSPEDQAQISKDLERELMASLHNPGEYFNR
jgi:hypothetical protein